MIATQNDVLSQFRILFRSHISLVSIIFLQALALLIFALVPVIAVNWLGTPYLGFIINRNLTLHDISSDQPGINTLDNVKLLDGYKIRAISGEKLQSPAGAQLILGQFSQGDIVTITVQSPLGNLENHDVRLINFPGSDRFIFLYIPYLIGLIYLSCGLWVFSVRFADRVGKIFTLFTSLTSIGIISLFDQFTTYRLTFLGVGAFFAAGGSLINLTFLFPHETSIARRYPISIRSGYILAAILFVLLMAISGINSDFIGYELIWRITFIFVGVSAIFFFGNLLFRRFASDTAFASEQARLILWGSVVSIIPAAFWFLLIPVRNISYLTAFLLFSTGIFPLVMAYTILHFRILNTDYVLSRAVLYALLSILVIAGYALLISGISLVLGQSFPPGNPIIIGILIFILAIIFDPIRKRLQKGIDSVFFKGPVAYRQRLQNFSRELTQVPELPGIIRVVRKYVDQALLPTHFHIYLHDSMNDHYLATEDESGKPTSDIHFTSGSLLAQTLVNRRTSIFLAEIASLPSVRPAERTRLAVIGAELFVPMPGRQHLAGWLAVGPRSSGEPYIQDDLSFLESLSDQAALAVERAQVITDLERHVRELNILARVAEGINITQAFDDLLELFYAQIDRLIPTRDLRITLLKDNSEDLYYALYLEDNERLRELENKPLPSEQGLESEVIRSHREVVTEDYERECHLRERQPNAPGIYAWVGVPLNTEAHTIGAVSLGNRDPAKAYTTEQVNFLQAIANLAAGAIVKAHLLEETEQRARQLVTLNEISRSLASTLELEPLLDQILQSAVSILDCESGSLLLIDEQTGESVFKVAVGPVGADLVGQRIPPGAGLVGKTVKTGQPIIQNDVRRSTEWYNTDAQTGYATQDLLVVPLLVKDRVIGVLEVLNKRDHSPFIIDDQELLTAYASQAAVAIENARLYTLTDQALAARVEELSVMQRVDRELNASLDVERAIHITLEWAMSQSRANAGLVGFITAEGVRIMASQGYPEADVPQSEGDAIDNLPIVKEAIRTGQPQLAGVSLSVTDRQPSREGIFQTNVVTSILTNTQTQLVVPIQRERRVNAVILLESTSRSAFPEDTVSFLSRLGDHAAIAVANAQLYTAVQSANQAKSIFVSSAAHELKNPLTSIKGYSDLLAKGMVGPVSEGQANFLSTIRANADRMSTLISDLQDISRIEANQLRLKFTSVSLQEVVDEVIRTIGHLIEDKKQILDLSLPEQLPLIWCDRDRLIQVVMNLVSNAYKYTPSGGEITIRAEITPNLWDNQGTPQVIHVAVKDNGIGISPEDHKKIFQQFFRSDDPMVREVSGTGLGLNITRNLVEMQGGRIWFESLYQHGTTFHFTVPIAETN
jgi:signal transduction histidine kinase